MKTLSNMLLILNPVCGFLIVVSIATSHWYLIFPLILVVILTLKFYCHQHKEEDIEYDKWEKEFSIANEYVGIGCSGYDLTNVWRNKETRQIFNVN